jgi:hypothetical protein
VSARHHPTMTTTTTTYRQSGCPSTPYHIHVDDVHGMIHSHYAEKTDIERIKKKDHNACPLPVIPCHAQKKYTPRSPSPKHLLNPVLSLSSVQDR